MTQNSTSLSARKRLNTLNGNSEMVFVDLLQIETHLLHVEPFNPSRRTMSALIRCKRRKRS